MPYVPGVTAHGVVHVADVYHSPNVYANFVPVALWQDPQGPEAAILSQILGPNFVPDSNTIMYDGEEDEALVRKRQQELVASGILKQEDLDAGSKKSASTTDPTAGNNISASFTSTTVDPSQTIFPDSYLLSANYTLGRMTKAPGVVFTHPVTASAGLSVAQIVANLQFLTQNCVEPIKAYRSDMFVTNSFRPSGIGSSTSQHPRGMACDIQFSKASKNDYFAIAQWIRDNVPYDQLLLEYKTTGTGLPWIHISFNKDGNRNQVMTFMNDKKYSNGLSNLA
jgi:hypothetical protein